LFVSDPCNVFSSDSSGAASGLIRYSVLSAP